MVEELLVVSYNIHGAVGRDGCHRPDRISAVLREIAPAIAGLQEVDSRRSSTRRTIQELAGQTGLNVLAGPSIVRGGQFYGNTLLSRQPFGRQERVELTVHRREPRSALIAETTTPAGRPLAVAVTHFGLHPGERVWQVARLIQALAGRSRPPFVLLGDLNAWWSRSQVLTRLGREFGPAPSVATFPSRCPLLALDRIFTRPPAILRRVWRHESPLARMASDHLPLVGELVLDGLDARAPIGQGEEA